MRNTEVEAAFSASVGGKTITGMPALSDNKMQAKRQLADGGAQYQVDFREGTGMSYGITLNDVKPESVSKVFRL